jgi:hypothetical protein
MSHVLLKFTPYLEPVEVAPCPQKQQQSGTTVRRYDNPFSPLLPYHTVLSLSLTHARTLSLSLSLSLSLPLSLSPSLSPSPSPFPSLPLPVSLAIKMHMYEVCTMSASGQ